MKTRENLKRKRHKKSLDDKKVVLVAQELKIARVLAGNEKSARDRALKSLRKWFKQRSETLPFTDDDLFRIWKGLFYSMWMSDKPLIQEECAENISNLVHCFDVEGSLQFFKCGMITLCREWFGIDQIRLEKFLMFVRRFLRQGLFVLKNDGFNTETINKFTNILLTTVLEDKKEVPMSLFLHFSEIYLEELAKVSEGNIKPGLVTFFIKPFAQILAISEDKRRTNHLVKNIFQYLMKQSDLGIEYEEKFQAWKNEGFPGTIKNMQKIDNEDSDEAISDLEENLEDSENGDVLDPRAGRVDVVLPQIPFHARAIANILNEFKFHDKSNRESRKAVGLLVKQFKKLANGAYPLGISELRVPNVDLNDIKLKKATNRLIKLDKKLIKNDKKRKRRKRSADKNDQIFETNDLTNLQEKLDKNADNDLEKLLKRDEELLSKTEIPKIECKKSKLDIKQLSNTHKEEKLDKTKSKKHKIEVSNDIVVKKRIKISDEKPDHVFKRNSGTWLVFNANNKEESDNSQDKISNKHRKNSKSTEKVKTSPNKNNTENKESDNNEDSQEKNPNFKRKNSDIFPRNAWDEPLKEGEYEICIPSRKHIDKIKKLADKSGKNMETLLKQSMKKNRLSLDSNLSSLINADRTKKVKINVKLNQSQEIDEHEEKVMSSPGIPYDANKKPSKPVIKKNRISLPPNPFYKMSDVW